MIKLLRFVSIPFWLLFWWILFIYKKYQNNEQFKNKTNNFIIDIYQYILSFYNKVFWFLKNISLKDVLFFIVKVYRKIR